MCAFITFKSDDAYNEAISYSKNVKSFARRNADDGFEERSILNKKPKFLPATEPTNIIWENRHIKGINFAARVVGAFLIAVFMLAVSFYIIILFKRSEMVFKDKFGSVNCGAIFKNYGEA